MTVSQRLLAETASVEANYAEVKSRIEELGRLYDVQERQAVTALNEQSRAIDARFEKQIAEIAAQLEQSLRESIVKVLRQNRDLEVDALRRKYEEQANLRRKRYEEQKRKYDQELYTALTPLMAAKVSPATAPNRSSPVIPCSPRASLH